MADDDRTLLGATGAFISFVAVSAIASVLVAAALTPAVAVAGIAASSSIDIFESLPDYVAIGELAEGSNI
ncbi:MAG: hypothetical protein ABWY30_00935, partial [Microterricola sp.]